MGRGRRWGWGRKKLYVRGEDPWNGDNVWTAINIIYIIYIQIFATYKNVDE